MDILEKIQNIFRDFFDDETLILARETTADDIEDWDSLAQINLIVACEEEFNTSFDINDISKLKNIGDMVDLVASKLE